MRVGNQLIIEDKSSYVYDHLLAQLQAVKSRLNSQFSQVMILGDLLSNLYTSDPDDQKKMHLVFQDYQKKLSIQQVDLYSPTQKRGLKRIYRFLGASITPLKERRPELSQMRNQA